MEICARHARYISNRSFVYMTYNLVVISLQISRPRPFFLYLSKFTCAQSRESIDSINDNILTTTNNYNKIENHSSLERFVIYLDVLFSLLPPHRLSCRRARCWHSNRAQICNMFSFIYKMVNIFSCILFVEWWWLQNTIVRPTFRCLVLCVCV